MSFPRFCNERHRTTSNGFPIFNGHFCTNSTSFSSTNMTRREMLKRAAQWGAFMAVAKRGDAQITTSGSLTRSTARACVFFYLNGAPSHVDTFDVKDGPWNPRDANIQQYH